MSLALSIPRHVLAWLALWCFWVVASRHNHPNWTLNGIATALLVATFALAVYANHLVLIPRLLRRGRILAYLSGLAIVAILLALACTLLIGLVYDLLWGPDPRRFGFGVNFAAELTGVALHLAVVAAAFWLRGSVCMNRSGTAPG